MGLFGSKTKTYIESSTQRLYEDRDPFMQESIIASVLSNGDFTSDFQANYLDSITIRGKQIIKYAENNYPYGLPNGTTHYIRAYDDEVRRVIKSEIGTNVEIVLNVVDVADASLFAKGWLEKNRGYNPTTLVITKVPFPLPPNAFGDVRVQSLVFSGTTNVLATYYGYVNSGQTSTKYTRTELVPLNQVVTYPDPYYHIGYYEVDKHGNTTSGLKYWFYNGKDTTYPSLILKDGLEAKSGYYPIVPIRMNKVDYTSPDKRNTKLFKTSRRILDLMDINIIQLGESIHASPDIKDVDHVYLILGVDIADSDQTTLTYLHTYFSYLYDEAKYTRGDFDYWNASGKQSVQPYNTITIADATYKMELTFNYITKEIRAGRVGEIGAVHRYTEFMSEDISSLAGYMYTSDTSTFRLTKQITSDLVEVITVSGLQHTNYVYSNHTVTTNLRDAFDKENEKNNFVVPINYLLVGSLSLDMSTDVMYRSVRIVLNSKIVKKLKWYETGFFQAFTKVVGLVLAVYGFYVVAAELIAVTTALQAAMVILQSVVVSMAVNFAVDFLVSSLGLEAALVLSIIGSAVAITGSNPSIGSIGGYKLPTAIDFLQITNATVDAVQSVTQDMISDVYAEMLEFKEYASGLLGELEDTAPSDALDPWAINMVDTTMDAWETPEEYLNRTTYSENIGILALETPATFVDRMLELDLPKNDIRTHLN